MIVYTAWTPLKFLWAPFSLKGPPYLLNYYNLDWSIGPLPYQNQAAAWLIRQPWWKNQAAAWLIRQLPDWNRASAWSIRTPVFKKPHVSPPLSGLAKDVAYPMGSPGVVCVHCWSLRGSASSIPTLSPSSIASSSGWCWSGSSPISLILTIMSRSK